MSFSFWGRWDTPAIDFFVRPAAYVLLAAYLIGLVLVFLNERPHLRRLSRTRVVVWIASLALSVMLSNFVLVEVSQAGGGPRPISLLVGIPVLLAGSVGVFPAAIVGLAAGVVQSIWVTHGLFTPFEMALWGAAAAFLVRQSYAGRLGSLLRLPVTASPTGALVMWVSFWLTCVAEQRGNLLVAILAGAPRLTSALLLVIAGSLVAGLVVQMLSLAFPWLIPARRGTRVPPYARSLKAQVLFAFVPIIAIVILVLFYVVNRTAVGVALEQSVSQAARDAHTASARIPFMLHTGQELLTQVAEDDALWREASQQRRQSLERTIRTMGFFKEIVLVDPELNPLDGYPTSQPLEKTETRLAQRVLASGAFQSSSVYRKSDGRFAISFLAPISTAAGGIGGILVGRADTRQAPIVRDLLTSLQNTMDTGVGFLINEDNLIIAHPDEALMLTPWAPNPHPDRIFQTPDGLAYLETAQDGSRRLVFVAPVQGHPWKTVILIPYGTILALAAAISTPFTLILLLVGLLVGAGIPLISGRFTRPVEALSRAAARIADGQVDVPVEIRGETEVGQLGGAFETMRISLQKRLKELALLLNVSRAVSAHPNLENLEPILIGAMQATSALCSRIILLGRERESPIREISMQRSGRGSWRPLRSLAAPVARMVQDRRAGRVRDTSIYPDAFSPTSVMALGFPLLVNNRLVGLLLVEFEAGDDADESEMEFLSTLAGQAAVVVEGAQLFEAVESERRRLQAILESATDAIVVTDSGNTVRLINSAARRALSLGTDPTGRSLAELPLDKVTRQVLLAPDAAPDGREIVLSNNRTVNASVSPLAGAEGQVVGRVIVMHDITHLKEMDALKSEFMTTAAHDLKSPVTAMIGYTTMLLQSDDLSDRQREIVDRMRSSINQITTLIFNLLDINKIEQGIGVAMAEVPLDRILEGVLTDLKGRAAEQGLALKLEISGELPSITGDHRLIRQAVTNLVDNAIKYTRHGSVTISARRKNGEAVVAVKDTGIGIPESAQARLFEKLYRYRTPETARIQGSGLGLAIVKGIAERHGGRVWVESEVGQGSTFYLALPVKPRAAVR